MTRRLCLITGASSGIGAAFARIYASHGYDLALTARRVDRLERLADEIRLRDGVETFTLPADLSHTGAADHLIAQIAANGRSVDVLVNNAGYGSPGEFAVATWEVEQAFLQVMLNAVCELTRKALPGMIERRFGRVVNVASLAGLVPGMAGQSLYYATKAFLIRFSQSLHQEMREQGVHVSALCPGFTYSEFHDAAGFTEQQTKAIPEWLWMGADEVAAAGYEAAEANRPICVPGAPSKTIAALAKVVPDEWTLALMAREQGRF